MNLSEITSKDLIDEINNRFLERENTVDEMKSLMKDLESMNTRLLKAEENRSKFMSIIKNEFNNPMATMITMSRNLLKHSNSEKANLIGNSLYEESLNLHFQINNIIMASEVESGTLEDEINQIDFNEILEDIEEILQYVIKNKNTKIKTTFEVENDIFQDRNKIFSILLNLLSNAIEFSNANSTVEISIFEGVDDIKFIVKDYGEGIPENEYEKIFARFYQAHSGMNRTHRGQGLGLSIVRELVDFMSGNIKFRSTQGEYTMFEITLPKLKANQDGCLSMEDDLFFDNDETQEF